MVQFPAFAWAHFSEKKVLNIRNFLSFFRFKPLKERFSKNLLLKRNIFLTRGYESDSRAELLKN